MTGSDSQVLRIVFGISLANSHRSARVCDLAVSIPRPALLTALSTKKAGVYPRKVCGLEGLDRSAADQRPMLR